MPDPKAGSAQDADTLITDGVTLTSAQLFGVEPAPDAEHPPDKDGDQKKVDKEHPGGKPGSEETPDADKTGDKKPDAGKFKYATLEDFQKGYNELWTKHNETIDGHKTSLADLETKNSASADQLRILQEKVDLLESGKEVEAKSVLEDLRKRFPAQKGIFDELESSLGETTAEAVAKAISLSSTEGSKTDKDRLDAAEAKLSDREFDDARTQFESSHAEAKHPEVKKVMTEIMTKEFSDASRFTVPSNIITLAYETALGRLGPVAYKAAIDKNFEARVEEGLAKKIAEGGLVTGSGAIPPGGGVDDAKLAESRKLFGVEEGK